MKKVNVSTTIHNRVRACGCCLEPSCHTCAHGHWSASVRMAKYFLSKQIFSACCLQQLIITQHFIRGEKPLARCTVDAFPGGGSHHKNQICRHRDLWWRTFSAVTFELGQVLGLHILHTLVTAAEQGDEEQSSRLIRGDQSSRHTQPRTTATSPSGKSELRGKSGDKKLIWQISGWVVAASGGQGCCWCCRWLISGAHLTVWTQISGDSGVTTVNMSTVQCSQCPVSNTLTMFIPIHTHNWSSFTFYIYPWQSSHYPDI